MFALHSVALFFFLAVITPGPNNLMIMTSAMNFGVVRSLPHFAGIVLGFPFMLFAMGMGLGQIFEVFPWMHSALQVACGVMIVYLAWKMMNFSSLDSADGQKSSPLTMLQAMAFQWVNPKAWFMASATVSLFPPRPEFLLTDSFTLVVVAFSVGVGCVATWMFAGLPLSRVLSNPVNLKLFNVTMAVGLVGFYVVSAMNQVKSS